MIKSHVLPSVRSQVILQLRSSSAASKEIRHKVTEKRREGQHQCWSRTCVASLGHPAAWARHILNVSSASLLSLLGQCQQQRMSHTREENVNISIILRLNFVIISFLPWAPSTITKHICTDLHFLLKCWDLGNVVTAQNPCSHLCARSKSGSYLQITASILNSTLRPRHKTAHQNLMQFTEAHPSDEFKLHRYTKRRMLMAQCVMMMLSNANLSSA